MGAQLLDIVLILACAIHLNGGRKTSVNRYEDMLEFDAVAVTRCDVICTGKVATEKEKCHQHCMSLRTRKLGECPDEFEKLSMFEKACMNSCLADSLCPETEKCCKHSCGITCQPAQNLEDEAGLPPIPTNVTIKELRGQSAVEIRWTSHTSSTSGILFLIEARHHFGRFFHEQSLSLWEPFFQTTKSPAVMRGIIAPAQQYVFRVSAVNANGTKGYSVPSLPFIHSRLPGKPGTPKRLRVVNVRLVNGTVNAKLMWNKPKSEVPIKRYKVFWSRRLPGHPSRNETDSVMVHQRNISKRQMHFQLENLKKNELYYIQVQAMAVYGPAKLKSEKAELLFNTKRLEDQSSEHPKKHSRN